MRVPAVFRTVKVYIGQPLDLDGLLGEFVWDESDKVQMMRNYTGVSEAIMANIRRLNPHNQPAAAE